jgi:hypothetical protein
MANIIAEAVEKAALVTRQASGLFDVSLIPSVCTDQCTTYTSVFGTCPTDPSAAVCQTACNVSTGKKKEREGSARY